MLNNLFIKHLNLLLINTFFFFKIILKLFFKVLTFWQMMTHSYILKRATAKSLDSKFQAPT